VAGRTLEDGPGLPSRAAERLIDTEYGSGHGKLVRAVAGTGAGAARAPGEDLRVRAVAVPGGPLGAQPGSGGTAPALPSTVRSMFIALGTTPAFAFDDCADVVAVNRAARFLFADFDAMPARDRNMTVWMLTDPRARSLYGSAWEEAATTMIGALRRAAGRQPGNPPCH
jgi:MmyB-like transcription regulator ligand binding domain